MAVWGSRPQAYPAAVVPSARFSLLGLPVTSLQVVILLLSFTLMLVIWFVVEKTTFGAAIRATALDRSTATLMGIDVRVVIFFIFALGPALGGIAGVMNGMYYRAISFNMGWTYGLKAFTATILGGIGNIPGAMIGGLAAGAHGIAVCWLRQWRLERRLRLRHPHRCSPLATDRAAGREDSGKGLRPLPWESRRTSSSVSAWERASPLATSPSHSGPGTVGGSCLAITGAVFAAYPFLPFISDYWIDVAFFVGIYALLGLSLNIVLGEVGLFDLGHTAFYAIGAYVTAILNTTLHLPIIVLLPLSALVAAGFAYLVTSPVIHLKGDYLCIVTIGIGEIVRLTMINNPFNLTGGTQRHQRHRRTQRLRAGHQLIDSVLFLHLDHHRGHRLRPDTPAALPHRQSLELHPRGCDCG